MATGFDILHDNGNEATTTNRSSSSSTSTPIWEEWKADWDAVEEIVAAKTTAMTCQMDDDEDDDDIDEDEDDNDMGAENYREEKGDNDSKKMNDTGHRLHTTDTTTTTTTSPRAQLLQ